ncbi:MAG: S-layer homology domain-containing protein [Thermoanaerobaculia bacterium]
MKTFSLSRRVLLGIGLCVLVVLGGAATAAVQDTCGPFTDVSAAICPYVLEMYDLGITAGTSATTFSPNQPMTRGQAAVFVSKGVNQAIARSSRRAALGQWWTPKESPWHSGLGITPLPGGGPLFTYAPVVCDGQDVWIAEDDSIFRVRASDGKLLETWTTVKSSSAILVAMGRVFAVAFDPFNPNTGTLSMIDPAQPAGAATVVASGLPSQAVALAFDGARIWATDPSGFLSIITPTAATPWATTVVTGFPAPAGIVFDGSNMWITDAGTQGSCHLFKLNSSAAVLQTVTLAFPCYNSQLAFDGSNVLAPNGGVLQVVRVSDGVLIATIPVNGSAVRVAFDGERILILVTSGQTPPPSLAILRAADLSTIQVEYSPFNSWPYPFDAASDGVSFWITIRSGDGFALARY